MTGGIHFRKALKFWNGLLMEMDSPQKRMGIYSWTETCRWVYQSDLPRPINMSTCQHVNVSWIVYIYIYPQSKVELHTQRLYIYSSFLHHSFLRILFHDLITYLIDLQWNISMLQKKCRKLLVTKKLLFFGRPLEAPGDVRRGRHRDASHSAGRDRLDEGPVLRQDRRRGRGMFHGIIWINGWDPMIFFFGNYIRNGNQNGIMILVYD